MRQHIFSFLRARKRYVLATVLVAVLAFLILILVHEVMFWNGGLRHCDEDDDCIMVKCDSSDRVIINNDYLWYWHFRFGRIDIADTLNCRRTIECADKRCSGYIGRAHSQVILH